MPPSPLIPQASHIENPEEASQLTKTRKRKLIMQKILLLSVQSLKSTLLPKKSLNCLSILTSTCFQLIAVPYNDCTSLRKSVRTITKQCTVNSPYLQSTSTPSKFHLCDNPFLIERASQDNHFNRLKKEVSPIISNTH